MDIMYTAIAVFENAPWVTRPKQPQPLLVVELLSDALPQISCSPPTRGAHFKMHRGCSCQGVCTVQSLGIYGDPEGLAAPTKERVAVPICCRYAVYT